MWEIFTCGRVPYAGIHVMGLLSELKAGNRLEKPENKACHNGVLVSIVKKLVCLSTDQATQ